MTANERRPGFRLPWSSESDAPGTDGDAPAPAVAQASEPAPSPAPAPAPGPAAVQATAPAAAQPTKADAGESAEQTPTTKPATEPTAQPAADPTEAAPASEAQAAPTADAAPGDAFMRDLVAAMRRVAEEAREARLSELRSRAEERVRSLEEEAQRRREELRAKAEADVAGVGEWAKAEAERIKAEADARVLARRAELEQQLAGEASRTDGQAEAVRGRVAEYERELAAYQAQLSEIDDPAAFAAAAKRMPPPPNLDANGSVSALATRLNRAAESKAESDAQPAVVPPTPDSNGLQAPPTEIPPGEEEVLAARLAELDAVLPEAPATSAAPGDPVTTEVVVKGLGSFGAITGFRQALSGLDGIEGVALSLGQTGEFVFRATHAAGFDLRSAIKAVEGDGATIEDRPEGGLRVTLDRAR